MRGFPLMLIKQNGGKMEKTKTKTNPWIAHVKKCKAMPKNKGKSLKEVLKDAKKTYKK